MPLRWPFPSLISVSFGLRREYPWGLSALSVKRGYKPGFKFRFAHFSSCFFPKCYLDAGFELLLGVQFNVVCAALQAAFSLGELDIGRAQECATVLPTRSCCKPPSFQAQLGLEWSPEMWNRICVSRISIFSVELVSQPDIIGGGRRLPEILKKWDLEKYSSSFLALYSLDVEELIPVCFPHHCIFALDLQQDNQHERFALAGVPTQQALSLSSQKSCPSWLSENQSPCCLPIISTRTAS